jgi:phosphatidylserine decarboxylase
MRIAPEGCVFVLPLAGATILCWLLGWQIGTILGFVLTASVALFFRDPSRLIPAIPEAVVAPADGKVMEICAEGDMIYRISIFLSPWDVHINRAPYDGKISAIVYTPGKFLAAYRREASLVNEANSVTLEHQGKQFIVKQIAGVLARRIVCRVHPGDVLQKGQRYGLIRFGSRTDLVLPREAEVIVQVGDVVRGGETVLAFLKEL